MQALTAGSPAPDFTLKAIDGSEFSLHPALTRGPVLLAFFKVSCPVCQFAFPFVERIYRAHEGKNLKIVGISQDDARDTKAFMKQFGVTLPVLLDDPKTYPVSNAYGLTHVPTLFWIGQDGTIEVSSVSWMRQEVEGINSRAARVAGEALYPLFKPNENVPEFRPG
jgi:cytochrome c biogenesis protein CcmG/thiol:disulfide interchange protein DsbE